MNHRHRKVLHALFDHPISSNISFKDVESLLSELGGTLGHSGHGKLKVDLNGHSAAFSTAQHSVPKEEVVQIRKFIEDCGIDPGRDYPV
ncbi:MAG: hypothetical protein U1E46_10350 [Hyphomicrobiales bacterium]